MPRAVPEQIEAARALHLAGKLKEAEAIYRRVLHAEPRNVEALRLLGAALSQQGDFAAGLRAFERAVGYAPGNATLRLSFGTALKDVGRIADAESAYREALQLNPQFADAWFSLGYLLHGQARFDEAEACVRRCVQLAPRDALAHNLLGMVLLELGRAEPAAQCFDQALNLDPGSSHARGNLGTARMALGRPKEAADSFRQALRLDAGNSKAHSDLIFALDLLETSDTREQQEERRRWGVQHADKFGAAAKPHENVADPGRRLRVGYVSADFRQHSAYHVFSPVIRRHDPAAFEVFCYSGVTREDEATERLRKAAHTWRSTLGVTDDALAEQIRADRIDILVDLSGHTAGNRLFAFARKPAPVQVTAWGHATGTGMKAMDYLFSDPGLIPPQERALYTEQIFDLPAGLCYGPPDYLPPVSPLPAAGGEPFTFGCMNRLEKISDRAIALWGRILSGAGDARLLLKDKPLSEPSVRQAVLRRLSEVGGIAPERVVLLGATNHLEHLKVFGRIDIGLDPFPQGGGVSTAEAIYMGVPVVALRGATLTSRLTARVLDLLALPDWIAGTQDDYVRIALEKKQDLEALGRLRQELRARLRQSPYGDMESYTRAVEQAYRSMWLRWCSRA